MTNRDKKAIEAVKVLREHCGTHSCISCIFYTAKHDDNGCMFNGEDVFPLTWKTEWLEEEVDVVDVNTGSCQRFNSLAAAAAFVGISFDRARYSMKTGKVYLGYVIKRVEGA